MDDAEDKKSKVSMMVLKSQSNTRVSQIHHKSFSRLKVRKHSFGFSSIHGIRPAERSSQIAIEFKRPHLMYLPTYQLESHHPFNVTLVTRAIEDSLEEHFSGHIYHIQGSPALALRIAGEVLRKVKMMNFNRYRIITVVTIGQKRAQSYTNAISFLWDHEQDNYVDVQKEVNTAFIQVTIFGVYLD